jgi:hypothetical protein
MNKRLLGSLEVSAIGPGCLGLSANDGDPVDPTTRPTADLTTSTCRSRA